jgi:hypothetical protein
MVAEFMWLDSSRPDVFSMIYMVIESSMMVGVNSSVIKGGGWDWMRATSENMVHIQSKLSLIRIENNDFPFLF